MISKDDAKIWGRSRAVIGIDTDPFRFSRGFGTAVCRLGYGFRVANKRLPKTKDYRRKTRMINLWAMMLIHYSFPATPAEM